MRHARRLGRVFEPSATFQWWAPVVALVAGLALLGPTMADTPKLPLLKRKSEPRSFDYPTIGENSRVLGLEPMKVEGVGLVHGLRGTGSDPPPGEFRETVLDHMRRNETFHPKEVIASDRTGIVLLRAFIPPGARQGQRIDVEAWVPPGDRTSSLAHGYLLEADLTVKVLTQRGGAKDSEVKAHGQGPILVLASSVVDDEDSPELRKGKVLGGCRVLHERNFMLILGEAADSGRRIRTIEALINRRFHVREASRQDLIAIAKTRQAIELHLPPQYEHDVERFLLVVRRIPYVSSLRLERTVLESLAEKLHQPAYTLDAALRLEAIGKPAKEVLKEGLESDLELVRFASAQSLAFIGDAAGCKTLGDLAVASVAYRPHAIGALASLDHPASRQQLTRLLDLASAECRYGAFRALWAADERDPRVRGQWLNDDFWLHEVQSQGEPMIHLSRNFRPEVALFGDGQALRPPLTLRAGDYLMVNADLGQDVVHLAAFQPGPNGVDKRAATCSTDLREIIRTAAELGATYPDIVDLLQQAKASDCLVGRLEVNALPRTLRLETLEAIGVADARRAAGVTDPAGVSTRPGLFTVFGDDDEALRPLTKAEDADEGEEIAEEQKRSFWDKLLRRNAN